MDEQASQPSLYLSTDQSVELITKIATRYAHDNININRNASERTRRADEQRWQVNREMTELLGFLQEKHPKAFKAIKEWQAEKNRAKYGPQNNTVGMAAEIASTQGKINAKLGGLLKKKKK